jgi:hypothetical protein
MLPLASRRILTNTVPYRLNSRVTAASRARSSLDSGRLDARVRLVLRRRARETKDGDDLLGNEDASAGRVDALSIDATDLVARGRGAEATLTRGRQCHGVRGRRRTDHTAVLSTTLFSGPARSRGSVLDKGVHDGGREIPAGLESGLGRGGGSEDIAARLVAELKRGRTATK